MLKIANCPRIPSMGGIPAVSDNVLDILFFTDSERKGIQPGKEWAIRVNVTRPERERCRCGKMIIIPKVFFYTFEMPIN